MAARKTLWKTILKAGCEATLRGVDKAAFQAAKVAAGPASPLVAFVDGATERLIALPEAERQQAINEVLDKQLGEIDAELLRLGLQNRETRAELSKLSRALCTVVVARKDGQPSVSTVLKELAHFDDLPESLRQKLRRHVKAAVGDALTDEQAAKDREFEQEYREAVTETLDEMELFGIDPRIDPAARKQRLMIAYLTLNLTSERAAEQAPTPFEHLLGRMDPAKRNKVLIRGDAGSGKTTLLKWAAIRSAGALPAEIRELALHWGQYAREIGHSVREESEAIERKTIRSVGVPRAVLRRIRLAAHGDIQPFWEFKIPFFVPLRKCRGAEFPSCGDLPSLVNASLRKPPPNWVESILAAGRGLVLIDGVDEVPPRWRKGIQKGIDGLLKLYGKKGNLFVVTSRPLVEDPAWIAEHRFQEAHIAPMSETDRNELIRLWHEAVAKQLREHNRPKEAAGLPEKAERLKADLARNPMVAQLAANPLMCAMLCALCGELGYKLPDSQYEIVEQLCKVLLHSREEHTPDFKIADFPPAYRRLKYPQRKAILARLAYDMVRGGRSAAPRQALIAKADDALGAFTDRGADDGTVVVDTLIERSGMLRKFAGDEIDFIHNTFKEFLASDRFIAEGQSKELARKCLQAGYKNVCLFAAAAERAEQFVDDLLKRVLPPDSPPGPPARKGQRRKTKTIAPEVHERRLLAIRMREVAVLPDPKLAQRVDGLHKGMFPPRTLPDAEALAALGNQVVDELAYRSSLGLRQKVRCVRALRLIGTEEAAETLQRYAQMAKEAALLGELVQAMGPLKIPDILRRVTSEPPQGVLSWSEAWLPPSFRRQILDLRPLSGLTGLTTLDLGFTPVSDLTPLAGLTGLTTLDLWSTPVSDLTPLARLTGLTMLFLSDTQVSDLAVLSGLTGLTTLDLRHTQVSDLTPLSGLTALTTLYLTGTQVSDLTPLAGLTALTTLYLIGTPVSDLTPLAGLTELRKLNLRHTQVSDLAPLAGLTGLTTLDLWSTAVSNLTPLAGLTGLMTLKLWDTPVSDLTPLARLTGLTTLDLAKTQVSDLTPLAGLTGLTDLNLYDTPVSELTPLAGLINLKYYSGPPIPGHPRFGLK